VQRFSLTPRGSRAFASLRCHKTLAVIAVSVSDEDCFSPVGINRCNTAPTPTGFPEFVGYDFPVLHSIASILIIG
jgi:hypothetical protein